MGDWYEDADGGWHHSSDEPTPDPTVTAMLPAVTPATPLVVPGQDDLTSFDHAFDISNTEKLGPLDEVLVQPPQDPAWRPA